jgi:CO/xanthine dehydrogenase FAD-binding subunit
MPLYARPTVLDEALQVLSRGATILAGGTDHYPARVGKPLSEPILDITAIRGLRGIVELRDHWRIGATTTWTNLIEARLPPVLDGLKLAAREIGGVQIQNSGTLAGNICNASPAADGVPALLSLDAVVELASANGVRTVPMDDFILGPRKTVRRPDELVAALRIPKPRHEARSNFLKLGARKYLVISISMVAAVLEHKDGIIQNAKVAVGSCSGVARRMIELEFALGGQSLDASLPAMVRVDHLGRLGPIDDVRASAAYRMDATLTLLRRTLAGLVQ